MQIGGHAFLSRVADSSSTWSEAEIPGGKLFGKSLPEPRRRREGCRMNLLETLALLTFILGLLGLIVDVVRLTIEVMEKTSQKKNDDNKKD